MFIEHVSIRFYREKKHNRVRVHIIKGYLNSLIFSGKKRQKKRKKQQASIVLKYFFSCVISSHRQLCFSS